MQTSYEYPTPAQEPLPPEWAKGMLLPTQALLRHFDLAATIPAGAAAPNAGNPAQALQAVPFDIGHAIARPATAHPAAVPYAQPLQTFQAHEQAHEQLHEQEAATGLFAEAAASVATSAVTAVAHQAHASAHLPEFVLDAQALDWQNRQGFRVGEVGLMIGYDDGSELNELPDLYFLPNAPAWFAGLANLHGLVLPVVDLQLFLGVAATHQPKRMLLVLGRDADAVGIVIDSLPVRLRWAADMQVDTGIAPASLQGHIKNAYLIQNEVWFDLNVASLLAAVEQSLQQGAA